MRTLTYAMGVSLDGYIGGPEGEIDWSDPDPELHQFHNDRTRSLEGHLLGRRLYETMTYWEELDLSEANEIERDFAEIWRALPKVVFSSTLTDVVGNTRLVSGDAVAEVEAFKAEGDGEWGVGGARLAHALLEHDLIDECQLFVYPIVLGDGIPFFPKLDRRLEFELVESRTLPGGVVYLRQRRVR
ncbi:MAG TPA: dihydrofolate reductase family protein [Solirubrobacterales bacterium]